MMGEDRKIPEDARREQNPTKRGSTWGRAPWPGTSEDPEFDERMSGDFWVYIHDLLWDFIHQVLSSEPGQEPAEFHPLRGVRMPWILLMHLLRPPSLYFSNVNFQSPAVLTGLGLYNNLPRLPPSPSPTPFTDVTRGVGVEKWLKMVKGNIVKIVMFAQWEMITRLKEVIAL